MATRLAIMGLPNSGKSYSRTYLPKGEESFVINPSIKETHLFTSQKNEHGFRIPVDELDMSIQAKVGLKAIAENIKVDTYHEVIHAFSQRNLPDGTVITGNYAMVPDLKWVESYLRFIDRHMPHIKNIFIADFTHFLSNVVSSKEFKRQGQSGSGAFERYWDLAANSLNHLIRSSDILTRKELIVAIEFHSEYDEKDDVYKIKVPAGKMLTEKYLPESYFDYMVHTHVVPYDGVLTEEERFKFVVIKRDRYDGRMANIFKDAAVDGMIPNNMNLLLTRLRAYLNI